MGLGRMVRDAVVRAMGIPAYWFARVIDPGYQETLFEPYRNSVWVQTAITKIAGPVASVPVCFYKPSREMTGIKAKGRGRGRGRFHHTSRGRVWRADDDQIDVPVMDDFLRAPVKGLGYADFVEASLGWMCMAGEWFWLLQERDQVPFPESRTKAPQVVVARPDRMRHVVENNELVAWEYRDGQSNVHTIPPESLIQEKRWNPYDIWRGLSQLESATVAAEADWLAGKFSRNLMANNGDTGPYIVAKNGVPTESQREQILTDLRAKRQAQQRGDFRPIFLTGDISVEDPKVRAVDSSFIEMRLSGREEIFSAFNIPPSLSQVKASYSIGSASDFYQLITTACIPAGEKFADALERLALMLTGQEVEILLDWDEHPVMQEVRKERFTSVDTFWQKGMPMSEINDFLGLGLPKYDGWDVGYLPINLTPASEATAEPAPSEDESLSENPPGGGPGLAGSEETPSGVQEMVRLLEGRMKERKSGTKALWEGHMRKRRGVVRMFQSRSSRVFNEWRGKVLGKWAAYAAAAKSRWKMEDGRWQMVETRGLVDLIFDPKHFGGELRVALEPVQHSALQTAADDVMSELGVDPWKFPPAKALEFIDGRKGPLTHVGDTVRNQLNTAIEGGVKEGASIEEITDSIKGVFNNLSKFEAKRIAMTETASAFGFSRNEAMTAAGVEYKSWLSSHGPTVREAHAEAEERYMADPIPMDEAFVVDGEELMFPGDPDGSPENIINCHCVQIAARKPKEEE